MKIVGLITEYNPFHNGHKLHIEEAKRITKADYVIVVMSGNFVQRGTPALMDKYLRTNIALEQGADIVIELPTCYATASAEFFALGAVSILNKLGIVDSLCFGSECGDIDKLRFIANILLEEPEKFKRYLASHLKLGKTYPAARSQALLDCYPELKDTDIASILASPNNILGIEYIKALTRLESRITPYTITRQSAGYHDPLLYAKISSASAIRLSLSKKNSLDMIEASVPKLAYEQLVKYFNITYPIFENDYSLLLQYKLILETFNSLKSYQDISDELANRIHRLKNTFLSYSELALELKSKQITLTRVNRALIHILLNMKKNEFEDYNKHGYVMYARLLGFQKEASFLIRMIKEKDQILVINKVADAHKNLSSFGKSMLEQDILASNLYNKIIYEKYHTTLENEYTHGVIIL